MVDSEEELERPSTLWLAAGVAMGGIIFAAWLSKYDASDNDFVQLYTGIVNQARFKDPYFYTSTELGLCAPWHYGYPPLASYLLQPLSRLTVAQAGWIWFAFNLAGTVVLAWMLLQLAFAGRTHWAWILPATGGLLWYPPQAMGNMLGQSHNVLALLFGGALLCLGIAEPEQGPTQSWREYLAGGLLAGAVLWKVFPALFLPALWLAGRRRPVVIAVGLSLFFTLATLNQHVQYFQRYVLGDSYPLAAQVYVSIPAVAARLFTINDYGTAVADAPWIVKIVALGALIWVYYRIARLKAAPEPSGERCDFRNRRLFAGGLIAMLLATPPAGYYHQNLAVMAVALIWPIIRRRGLRPFVLAALAGTMIPVQFGIQAGSTGWIDALYQLLHHKFGLLLLAPQVYALLALFLIATSVRLPNAEPE